MGNENPLSVQSPFAGEKVGLDKVNDPVFSGATVGDGVAVIPPEEDTVACAPISGKALRVMPHAFVILNPNGKGVLVHIGIDTVRMKGESFEVLVEQGSKVEAGEEMIRFSPKAIKEAGYDPICPVIAMDTKAGDVQPTAEDGPVAAGDELFSL